MVGKEEKFDTIHILWDSVRNRTEGGVMEAKGCLRCNAIILADDGHFPEAAKLHNAAHAENGDGVVEYQGIESPKIGIEVGFTGTVFLLRDGKLVPQSV